MASDRWSLDGGSARQQAGTLPVIAVALGVAALVSAWAVFVVVIVATPWLVGVLLPWSRWLRRNRPRAFTLTALLGAVLVVAGVSTAVAVDVAVPGALTAGVALVSYVILIGVPLLSDAP